MNYIRQQEKRSQNPVLFVAALILLSLAGATSALAQQCTDSWTGGGGNNNWSNGANWSNGNEPGNSDAVCIQTSGAAVVLDVGDGVAGLALGSSDSLTFPTPANTNNGLSISGSSITNSGQIIMAAPVQFGSTGLNLSSSGTVTLSGGGTITLNANSFGGDSIGGAGTLLNKSTIQGGGAIDMTVNNTKIGVVKANESGVQLVLGRNQAHNSTNTGVLEATDGGQLAMGSLTLNNVGGTIKASGKNSYVQLEGEGQGGETFTGGTWTTANGGIIQVVDSSALLDGTNGNTITNSGTMQLVDGASHPGGNFQGTINNTGIIQVLSKGDGVGLNIPNGQTFTLTGTGNLTMGDGTSNAYNNDNYISGGTLVSQQLIQGTGTIQNLTSFSNSGTINDNVPTGTNNLQLVLGRAGASTNTGTIEATNGGALLIGSTTINNVGGTFAATGANSYVDLVGSLGTSGLTISGGTYTTSEGGTIYGEGFTILDGTTNPIVNSGTIVVPDINQNTSGISIQGTLKNTNMIKVLSTGDLVLLSVPDSETFTLTGIGKVVLGDGTNNGYNNLPSIGSNLGSSGTFVNESTIEGSGIITLVQGITNKGVINDNVPVGTAGVVLSLNREGSSGIINQGTIEASNGGEVQFYPSNSFDNPGTLTAAAKSTIFINNNFVNLSNGTLTGGTYNVTGTLEIPGNITTNDAKITLSGKTSQILNPNSNALAGFVTNASKGSFDLKGGQSFTSAGTFTNQGAIVVGKGSTFTVGSGGSYLQTEGKTTVDGKLALSTTEEKSDEPDSDPAAASVRIAKGTLLGNGGTIAAHVSSSGTVIPAASLTTTGKLAITGAYTQTAAGALDANIAGASSGQFNVLNVTGTATIGGTLNIGLLDKFVPAVGDAFEILTARKVTGTFATVNGTKINDSEHFTVTYNPDNVTLSVVSGD